MFLQLNPIVLFSLGLILFFGKPSDSLATTEIRDLVQSNARIEDLPCPSENEYSQMIKDARINLNSFKDFKEPLPPRCGKSPLSLLVRLLLYFKHLSVSLPIKHQNHEILQQLKEPWPFFIKSFQRLELYYSKRAYAAFDVNSHNLLVTKLLFENSPVAAVAALIHEAAHGRDADPGHAQCQRGNLKYTLGACDEVLEIKDSLAGAYTYEFWFLWMMSQYAPFIDQNEKINCRSEAEQLIANRFNYVHQVAQFNDLLVVLDASGTPQLLDPLTGELVDIGLREKIVQEPTVQLFKEERNMGVAFLSKSGRLTSWDAIAGQKNEIHILPMGDFQGHIKKYLRGYNFKDDVTRSLILDDQDRAYIEATNANAEREYVLDHDLMNLGTIEYVEMLSHQQYLVLLETGSILAYEKGKALPIDYSLLPKKIRFIASDLMGHDFYFITQNGQLNKGQLIKDFFISSAPKVNSLSYAVDDFQNGRARKYSEGIGYRVLLSQTGELKLKRHSIRSTQKGWLHYKEQLLGFSKPIQDFVIIRTAQLDSDYDFKESTQDFEEKCQAQTRLFDPWLHRPLGIDWVHNLVLFHKGICRVIARNVKDAELHARSIALNVVGLRESEILIHFLDGRKTTLTGYEGFNVSN